jgi:hypothetical protein
MPLITTITGILGAAKGVTSMIREANQKKRDREKAEEYAQRAREAALIRAQQKKGLSTGAIVAIVLIPLFLIGTGTIIYFIKK